MVATDPTAANNCVTDTVEGEPGLEIDKTSETITDIGLGETITYEFAVTNTGNVTLYDVASTTRCSSPPASPSRRSTSSIRARR